MAKSELKRRFNSEESSDNDSGLGSAEKRQKTGIGEALMAKMGHIAGRGLGKTEQGIIDAIQPSDQKGRRGLGFTISDVVVSDDLKWSPEAEKQYVAVEEEVVWMPEPEDPPPGDNALLKEWISRGPRPVDMEEETEFCDVEVVRNVCKCKSVFDRLSSQELRNSRSGSNPFETIGKVFFQNRAALKMANMDARFDMMFTDPKNEEGQSLEPGDLLYFADICAGPGGFSEYVLWRKKWEARGFGFTLKGPTDFKLEEFLAASTETFEPHYGDKRVDEKGDETEGSGDIYVPQNLIEFRNFVLSNSDGGVHFVMADGGFSVEGEENNQEILSKRLYLCQFLCALGILRTGGHFVCKLFDCFTPFSVGLIYLMYRCFDRVCIFKPNTSRPANSERYLICKSKKSSTGSVENHLFLLNCILDQVDKERLEKTDDVIEIVPLSILKKDRAFYDYIRKSNTDLGRRQILFLSKVKAFAENSTLVEQRQGELRRECLQAWKVPDEIRKSAVRELPATKFKELMHKPPKLDENLLQAKPTNLTRLNLKSLEHHHSFRGIILGNESVNLSASRTRGILLCRSKNDTHFWDLTLPLSFTEVKEKLNLPPGTLVYAEQVYEMMGEGRGQRKIVSYHIIDALFLGEMDVRWKDLRTRHMLTEKLVKAVQKPTVRDLAMLRAKQLFELPDLETVFSDDLDMREFKSGFAKCRLAYNLDRMSEKREDNKIRYMEVSGLLIVPLVTCRYFLCWSKSQQKQYYFEKKTQKSEFRTPHDAIASFIDSFKHSFFWRWEADGRNTKDETVSTDIKDPDILDRDSFRRFFLSTKT